jgi:RNA methyltransferase, TrmH family
MNIITGSQNQIIKEVKSLKDKKHREEKGLFFIEGLRFAEEAIFENADIVRILISEKYIESKIDDALQSEIQKRCIESFLIPDKLFREVSDTENPQGILAVIKMKRHSMGELFAENNFLLILDSIKDPGNLGTMIRTADAAGVTGVIMSKGCVDLYNPKVLRSTMGSIFRVPVFYSSNLIETIKEIKSKNIQVLAAHLQGEINYFEAVLTGNISFIIGNEATGISDEVKMSADLLLKIPMPGRTESLNASVAAGLLMYEAVRQRLNKDKKF